MQIVHIGRRIDGAAFAEAIGAKAANLTRMAALGLPVPPAFVLPVKLCAAILDNDAHAERHPPRRTQGRHRVPGARHRKNVSAIADSRCWCRCGQGRRDRCRCMLDTVLDVGCTLDAVHGLIRTTRPPPAGVGLPATFFSRATPRRCWASIRRRSQRALPELTASETAAGLRRTSTAKRLNVSPPTNRR